MHGFHHAFQDRIENLARLLGVTVGEQFHGAFQVGEEDGDLLTLSLQRGLRRENLLGKVLWR